MGTGKQIIIEYLRNPEYAKLPRAKLARIIKNENPLVFESAESVRSYLRIIVGKSGTPKKGNQIMPEFQEIEDRPSNPYNLPKSDETDNEPFILPHFAHVAILSDIHVPYHSIKAITAVLDYYESKKPDALILNGDIIDMYQGSRFVRDPRKRSIAEELKAMSELVSVLRDKLQCPVYFKEGNHEERYDHLLFTKAKEIVGVEEFELEAIIRKRIPDVTYIKDKRIIMIGGKNGKNGLSVIHGHEFGKSFFSPVNPARGLFLRAKASALQGHQHQSSEHSEKDINDKLTTCWSTGCLSELYPDYAKYNKWNHGFAEVFVHADGTYNVHNIRIKDGYIL